VRVSRQSSSPFQNCHTPCSAYRLTDAVCCLSCRFGLGFNAVYHLTDLPSFVSGQHLVLFDPHAKYLPGEAGLSQVDSSAAQPGLTPKFETLHLNKPSTSSSYAVLGSCLHVCDARWQNAATNFAMLLIFLLRRQCRAARPAHQPQQRRRQLAAAVP
jgi:hypothetical protein